MKSNNVNWALATIIRKQRVIDPRPQYQRGPVWSMQQKQLLIDSILRSIDIPKIYLRELPDTEEGNNEYQYEIIDGQQRLRAIWEFHNNEYPLADDADSIGKFKIASSHYRDLPEKLKDFLDMLQLTIVVISDSSDQEIEEMFLRLQNGTTLKAAEKRNAISGKVRDYIRTIIKNKFFRTSVSFNDNRFAHDAVSAQMLLLEIECGPTDVKDKNLESLYRDSNFDPSGSSAQVMKRVLKFLAREFPEKTPELKKQTVVSLYLMVSDLLRNYNASSVLKLGDFKKWFINFESYKDKELNKDENENRDPDIESYNFSSQQGTNRKESIANRHEVLMKNFLIKHQGIEYKDQRRLFSHLQRVAIFRRDNEICQRCHKKVGWDNASADHIKPYSVGGKTNLENGQLLCLVCNSKKSNRV
jgi:hypothetical protein